MNGIVIYKGKYGATRQYAKWLGEELNLEIACSDFINTGVLKKYDYLVLGSSVYIGKLEIKKWVKKNSSLLANKKIFLFQVAATPVEEVNKRKSYNNISIPEDILGNCECFFLPGRMIMSKLSWRDRFMLKLGARLTKDPATKKSMLTDIDHLNKDCLKEMVHSIKKYTTKTLSEVSPKESVLLNQ